MKEAAPEPTELQAPEAEPGSETPAQTAAEPAREDSPAASRPTTAVDDLAYRQYQALAEAVLDSADLATQSAQTAITMSRDLKQTTAEVRRLNEGAQKKAMLLAVGSGVLMLLCLGFFLLMAVRLNSRVNQLDTMLLAVGKRAVELNTGLEALQDIDAGIQALSARQNELMRAQAATDARLETALKQSESLVKQAPAETARQVAESSDSVTRQVAGIGRQLQGQAGMLQNLGNELKSLRNGLADLEALKRDMERLVQQRAERGPDNAQKSAAALRERTVHYPRVLPRSSAEAEATPAP